MRLRHGTRTFYQPHLSEQIQVLPYRAIRRRVLQLGVNLLKTAFFPVTENQQDLPLPVSQVVAYPQWRGVAHVPSGLMGEKAEEGETIQGRGLGHKI